MPATRTSTLQFLSFFVLGAFLTFVLLLGISQQAADRARNLKDSLGGSDPSSDSLQKKPDLDQYVWSRTLSDEELDFDGSDRRVVFVGDIHGMKSSFDKLVSKLHFNSQTDHIIHAGDIVAKSTLEGSLEVLEYMTMNNVTGVRGNHDQMVIGWHAWLTDVLSHPGGASWLSKLENKSKRARKSYLKELKKLVKKGKEEKWKRIPEDWEFMGDHYTIARAMSEEQAAYLRALPLVLHIPRLHAFVVHAGLLPLDPRRSPTSSRQPLAHLPEDDDDAEAQVGKKKVDRMRKKQEAALITDIPQNQDPWVILNIRNILKDNSISRDTTEGTAWSPLWNGIVGRCGGFDFDLEDSDAESDSDDDDDDDDSFDSTFGMKRALRISKEKPLPCYPSTVIYGHAASRGLDIHRWSKGLDTGCVYGRRLTALVLTPPSHAKLLSEDSEDDEEHSISRSKNKNMRFGDHGHGSKTANAQIVSVSCPDL